MKRIFALLLTVFSLTFVFVPTSVKADDDTIQEGTTGYTINKTLAKSACDTILASGNYITVFTHSSSYTMCKLIYNCNAIISPRFTSYNGNKPILSLDCYFRPLIEDSYYTVITFSFPYGPSTIDSFISAYDYALNNSNGLFSAFTTKQSISPSISTSNYDTDTYTISAVGSVNYFSSSDYYDSWASGSLRGSDMPNYHVGYVAATKAYTVKDIDFIKNIVNTSWHCDTDSYVNQWTLFFNDDVIRSDSDYKFTLKFICPTPEYLEVLTHSITESQASNFWNLFPQNCLSFDDDLPIFYAPSALFQGKSYRLRQPFDFHMYNVSSDTTLMTYGSYTDCYSFSLSGEQIKLLNSNNKLILNIANILFEKSTFVNIYPSTKYVNASRMLSYIDTVTMQEIAPQPHNTIALSKYAVYRPSFQDIPFQFSIGHTSPTSDNIVAPGSYFVPSNPNSNPIIEEDSNGNLVPVTPSDNTTIDNALNADLLDNLSDFTNTKYENIYDYYTTITQPDFDLGISDVYDSAKGVLTNVSSIPTLISNFFSFLPTELYIFICTIFVLAGTILVVKLIRG